MIMSYVYSSIHNNIRYEAFYDSKTEILHVLDIMGFSKNIAYKSVTNGIDELLPHFVKDIQIEIPEHCFLYGTDNMITAYNTETKSFAPITEHNVYIFEEFKEKMNILYA